MKITEKTTTMRFRIVLFALLAFAACLTAVADEYTPTPINSEHYNKWSTSKHFVAGMEALNEGFADDAINEFSIELKVHPENSYARFNLIQARIKLLYDQFTNGLFKKNEDDTTALTQEFFDYYDLNGHKEIKELERSITILPAKDKESQCMAHLTVAHAYMDWFVTDTVEIINSLNNAVACHPCKNSYLERIKYYTNAQDDYLEYIEDDTKSLYELNPNDLDAIKLMALISNATGKSNNFEKYYNEYLKAAKEAEEDSDKDLDMIHAKNLTDEGRSEEAIDTYLKILSSYSDEEPLEALLSLTQNEQLANIALLKIGQMEFAEEGDNRIWDVIIALIHKCSLKDYKTAITYFKKSLDQVPGNALCLKHMANSYLMMGDLDNAKLYTHAYYIVTRDDNYSFLLYNLGEIDELLKNNRFYNNYLDVLNYDSEFYSGQAKSLILKKDYMQAINILDKAREHGMESISLDYQYGVALKKLGREEEAKTYFQKAFDAGEIEKEESFNIYHLASSIELGKPDTENIEALAMQWLKEQEQSIPGYSNGDRQLAYEIACLYAMMGDTANAMKFMELHFEHGEIPCNFGLIRLDWRLDSLKNLPEFVKLADKYYFKWKNNK